ncbi:hypothetical protein L3Q82_007579 [Scortum barcoo]|uniref:Uncharacterized protein n=1 Tax=Scortum barcoo TaxID=214431 RepID=A0ACB8WNU9_9TELE|nr:hypothetical protein L3Q82_007579 [Scortum barcoo]
MADTDETEQEQNVEAPEEELDDEREPLLQFGKYSEARRTLPWEQWTFREKANYYIDRIFLGILIIFFSSYWESLAIKCGLSKLASVPAGGAVAAPAAAAGGATGAGAAPAAVEEKKEEKKEESEESDEDMGFGLFD